MILGFKPQFVEPILKGTKKHTIRKDEKNRWKVGRKIDMATGVRTKKYNKFAENTCTGIQTIEIKWWNPTPDYPHRSSSVQVFIDGRNISHNDKILDKLVKNDGFDTRKEFFDWFSENYTGKIIHWTKLKYRL
jgi:hypothetical protein